MAQHSIAARGPPAFSRMISAYFPSARRSKVEHCQLTRKKRRATAHWFPLVGIYVVCVCFETTPLPTLRPCHRRSLPLPRFEDGTPHARRFVSFAARSSTAPPARAPGRASRPGPCRRTAAGSRACSSAPGGSSRSGLLASTGPLQLCYRTRRSSVFVPPPLTIKYCLDWFTPPNAKLERGSASTSVLVPLG